MDVARLPTWDINGTLNEYLMRATLYEDVPQMELILTLAPADFVNRCQNCFGACPIHLAAIREDTSIGLNMVKTLLRFGANPYTVNTFNQTPLMLAVSSGNVAVIDLFTRTWKCDVNVQDRDGTTALHYASEKENPRCARLLVEAGADTDRFFSDRNLRPLDTAVCMQNMNVVLTLLQYGCSPVLSHEHVQPGLPANVHVDVPSGWTCMSRFPQMAEVMVLAGSPLKQYVSHAKPESRLHELLTTFPKLLERCRHVIRKHVRLSVYYDHSKRPDSLLLLIPSIVYMYLELEQWIS